MAFFVILYLKIKNTLRYKHNLILLTALPALAAAGAWALLTFYLEGGANIPVGVLDYDQSAFSKTVVARFSDNSSVGVRELDVSGLDTEKLALAYESAGHSGADTGNEGLSDADDDSLIADSDSLDIDEKRNALSEAILSVLREDAAYQEAVRLVRLSALEAAIVVVPGFSDKIYASDPEGLFHVICPPAGVARGLAAELFAAQVSRIYFNSDSAHRVVRDAEASAKSAKNPPLTEEERQEIFDMAFAYCDSYWEPEPLMSIEYERFFATRIETGGAGTIALPGSAGGWQDMREMLNDLIARAVFAIFFVYAAFCIVNATGVMLAERSDGVLTRMRANGYGAGAWIAVSAAAPFILYGIPCAALLSFIINNTGGAVFSIAALACVSALGATAAYLLKKPGRYRVFILICVIVSAGVSLYMM